ncbi:MAG: hypothetical protein IPH20_23905 [Bacteroidales bacterium]|nr:hypothetical protein [Bacteroidales bacterium]
MRTLSMIIIALSGCLYSAGQSVSSADKLIPWQYVNQTVSKASKMVMGMESNVTVTLVAQLNDYNACRTDSYDGRLDAEVRWYNSADETGVFMLNMLKDMNGIEQEKENFRQQSGFEPELVKELEWMGGTLWFTENKNACVNEISGPTGVTRYITRARFFLFNGTAMIKIKIEGQNNSEKTKEILAKTLELVNGFDFSSLKNVVGSE